MKSAGITLLELLIFMALSVLTGILLVGIMISNSEILYKQSSRLSQGLDINDTLVSIKTNIRQASSVAISYPEAGPPAYTSSQSQLVLKLLSVDSSGGVIQNTFDFIVYLKEDDFIKILVLPDTLSSRTSQDTILAKNTDTLVFDYYDPLDTPVVPQDAKKVKISLVLKQKAGARFETNLATGEAILRND